MNRVIREETYYKYFREGIRNIKKVVSDSKLFESNSI